jgi:hypothetical protein
MLIRVRPGNVPNFVSAFNSDWVKAILSRWRPHPLIAKRTKRPRALILKISVSDQDALSTAELESGAGSRQDDGWPLLYFR